MENYGLILVPSTREAMQGEKTAKAAGFTVRIVPTPGRLEASCGFSLRYELAEEKEVRALFSKMSLNSLQFYRASRQGLTVTYTKLPISQEKIDG